jgi:cell wall-associated NlpC family hydrolase
MTTNSSQNFFYTPDVSVIIDTIHGPLNVGADVIDFTVTRQINAVSTFSCTLNNPNKKYNYDGSNSIRTMDRITVFLKRTKFVQVFTGFVTYAPLETIVPVPVTIQAQCTLRILQVTYWDDTLINFQKLLLNFMDSAARSSNETVGDGGVAQAIVNLLFQVVGWQAHAIHIQSIPKTFVEFMALSYNTLLSSNSMNQNVYAEISKAISAAGVISGTSVINGNNLSNKDAPITGGIDIPAVSTAHAFITKEILPDANGKNKPGSNPANPVNINQINSTTGDTEGIFYCSLPWSYLKTKMSANAISDAKTWIAHNRTANNGKGSYDGRLLLIRNIPLNRTVAVRATSVPQKTSSSKNQAIYDPTIDYAQMHPGVVAYLNGKTGDPTTWTSTSDPGVVDIAIDWADQTKVTVGIVKNFSTKLIDSTPSSTTIDSSSSAIVIYNSVNNVIRLMREQIGAKYSNDNSGPHYRETPNTPGKNSGGYFDCSGIVQWAYRVGAQIELGSVSQSQCGPVKITSEDGLKKTWTGYQNDKHGQWVPNTEPPQVGDILFFEVPGDTGSAPQHVVTLSSPFGQPNPSKNAPAQKYIGYVIAAHDFKHTLDEQTINWNNIAGGVPVDWGPGYPNNRYMGARRPISLNPNAGINVQSTPVKNTSTYVDPTDANTRAAATLAGAFTNMYGMPQYDPRAAVMVGTPRAFLLDNPVMNDITQILGAGLRMYQSAPNGDFCAWFPDYYGVYGTDPAMEISPVEIIDFQMYHDDNQLATHVGIVGDTTGIGQQVSDADYYTTTGIVSVQDTITMNILFKNLPNSFSSSAALANNFLDILTASTPQLLNNLLDVASFLDKYGMRPYVQEQQFVHSQAMEYFYALHTFMLQWSNQFVSTVQTTFLPEMYPGMRVKIVFSNENGTTDKYEFYCMGVTHQGSRSGGFTTQLNLTSPIKNGGIMHYGLELRS